jgi:hypothetical protein
MSKNHGKDHRPWTSHVNDEPPLDLVNEDDELSWDEACYTTSRNGELDLALVPHASRPWHVAR